MLLILLCAPAYFAVHLLLSTLRTSARLVLGISMLACFFLTAAVATQLSSSRHEASPVQLLVWLAVGWSLYVLLLFLRFRHGRLDQR